MEYTYSLQKYTGRDSRKTCPACGRPHCFALYVDEAGNLLGEDVGRCEHRNSCGYEKTPKQFFEENPDIRKLWKPQPAPKKETPRTDYIPFHLIQMSENMNNSLMRYLSKFFTQEDLQKATSAYHLGSTAKGEVIYPQIDNLTMCRTGKIMQYGTDGHRIKGAIDMIDWLHARYMKKQGKKTSDYHLKQCLFGEHILPKRPKDVVCLTESEKAAVIASIVFPAFVWVSCGGKQGLTPERCKALTGRDVIVYADADAVAEWDEKIKKLTYCRNISLSDWAKDEAAGSKRDIADLIIENKSKMQVRSANIGDVCKWMNELGISKRRVTFNL
ncbi:DUF6371 domain-containing protein [Bacteroides intestinalis]|uniref:Toprim domain-containing protein n=1 Tax=Bacteroides intestinalis TaxID=329854 RepID=A0A139LPK6_9BACE|nr:DUF6371 domain-containing protein [Bacteroides intestinalis]KXT53365.1 hypothetical protein HMPREF2531_01405 [Bacteroides intestinalis]